MQLEYLKCCVRGSGIEVFRVFPLPLDLSAHQTQVTICLSKLETLCRDVKGCHAVGRVLMSQVFKAQVQPSILVSNVFEKEYIQFILCHLEREKKEEEAVKR